MDSTPRLKSSSFEKLHPDLFPVTLRQKLVNESDLDDSDVRTFINVVYEQYINVANSYYPGDFGGYKALATNILGHYPNLAQNRPLVDAIEVMRAKLTHKFKNSRRRKSTALLEQERSSKVRKFGGCVVRGLPGFLPPATTDSIECCRQINSLRSNGNHAPAMEATFPHRRRMIIKEKQSISQLHQRFPPLFTAEGVWEEAKQLSRNPEVKQENLRDLDRTMTSVRLATKCLEGEELSNLCSILGEDVESIIQASGEQPNSHPHIAVREENFYVYIEAELVATTMNLREAILMLLWCVTIFHQKHNKGAKKTVVYLERYVLGVYHAVKVPTIVAETHKRLLKFM